MKTVEQVLSELPRTSEEIADYLRCRGIKGVESDDNQCPLASLIRLETGTDVRVGRLIVETDNNSFELGEGATVFVDAFDDGIYPDLIDQGND